MIKSAASPRSKERVASIEIAALRGHPQEAAVFPAVSALVHEAGNPFFDWCFGDSEQAAGSLAAWMTRSSSEVFAGRVTIAFAGGDFVGMFLGVGGGDLRLCRNADALALLAHFGREPGAHAALLERIQAARSLFSPVEPDELYLSKIGVVPEHRGIGIGRALTLEFLAGGRAAGFRRFRLDVSSDNAPAVRIYRSLGFAVEAEHETPGMHYLSMIHGGRPARGRKPARGQPSPSPR